MTTNEVFDDQLSSVVWNAICDIIHGSCLVREALVGNLLVWHQSWIHAYAVHQNLPNRELTLPQQQSVTDSVGLQMHTNIVVVRRTENKLAVYHYHKEIHKKGFKAARKLETKAGCLDTV